MKESSTLKPLRFRFTYEPDAKAYGNPDNPDGWWIYDESALTALPFSGLLEIEQHIQPLTLLEAMQGIRDESIIGMHAGSWVAIHTTNPKIAGPYNKYSPRDMLIHWERVPAEAQPEEPADPLELKTSPPSSPAESSIPSTASKRRSPSKRTSRPTR